MISAISGVVLSPADAEFVVGALDEFVRQLAERRSQPTPKLAHTIAQLRRATRNVAVRTQTTRPTPSTPHPPIVHKQTKRTPITIAAMRLSRQLKPRGSSASARTLFAHSHNATQASSAASEYTADGTTASNSSRTEPGAKAAFSVVHQHKESD